MNRIFGNFGAKSNGTVQKGNTFRGISFFSERAEFRDISVPFAHSYSAGLFMVILPRKNAKDQKDGRQIFKTFIVIMRIFAHR